MLPFTIMLKLRFDTSLMRWSPYEARGDGVYAHPTNMRTYMSKRLVTATSHGLAPADT